MTTIAAVGIPNIDMSSHRKKPFSAKQKKAQILEKRAKKKPDSWDWSKDEEGEAVSGDTGHQTGKQVAIARNNYGFNV